MMEESVREYIARAKDFDEEICRQILTVAFPSAYTELCFLKTFLSSDWASPR